MKIKRNWNVKKLFVCYRNCKQKIAEEEAKVAEKKAVQEKLNTELAAAKARTVEKQRQVSALKGDIDRKKRDLVKLQSEVRKLERYIAIILITFSFYLILYLSLYLI